MALNFETASAAELSRALRRREVSALELLRSAEAAIARKNPALNAVIALDPGRAEADARQADARLARGDATPLLGVPMTVKESHHVLGLATTWGIGEFADWRPEFEATGVARLRAAGAVILGKTNVPSYLADFQSQNPIYGRTCNPFDLERTPGGSSGGGAAAVAAGLVPVEYGSDIGGSIRVPAHFCGIFGHKPTFGLIPTTGHAPPGVAGPSEGVALGVVGPLARSAGDLEDMLLVLAGPEAPAARALRLDLPPPRAPDGRGLRFLVLEDHPLAAVDREVLEGVSRAAQTLSDCGARRLGPERLTGRLDLERLQGVYGALLQVITSRGRPGADGVGAHAYMDLLSVKSAAARALGGIFEEVDVILAPPFGAPAFPHEEGPLGDRRLVINGRKTPYGAQTAWACLASLTGAPASVAPAGRTLSGLPVGVQIIGPAYEDLTPIAVAALLEREGLSRFRPPPVP